MKRELLKKEVEHVVGHELREARDFEKLSQVLLKGTRERLSPTTLKRFWGYLKNESVQTRPHTLNVLAQFWAIKVLMTSARMPVRQQKRRVASLLRNGSQPMN